MSLLKKTFSIRIQRLFVLPSLVKISKPTIVILTSIFMLILSQSDVYAFGTKYAGEFLKIGLGIREMSLGGAVVASPQPTSSIYWNPSALANNEKYSGQFMHAEEFAGVLNLDQISFVSPYRGNFSYGVGFFRLGVDDIPDTRNALVDVGSDGIGPDDEGYTGPDHDGSEGNGRLDSGERLNFGEIGMFGASEGAVFLSAAIRQSAKLNLGGSMKLVYKSLGDFWGWGVGFDVGLIYSLSSKWRVGASLNDLTTTFLFWEDGEKEIIVPSLRIGTAYDFKLVSSHFSMQPLLGLNFSFGGEEHYTDLNLSFMNVRVCFGLELYIKEQIVLRAGRDDLGSYHIGLGINTPLGNIDYGFAMGGSYDVLGESHRLGLTLHFEELIEFAQRYL